MSRAKLRTDYTPMPHAYLTATDAVLALRTHAAGPVGALPLTEEMLRDWPVAALTADKNYGYAFQWFGLSALITLLYVWFQIGKRFNGKKSQAN